MHRGFKDVTPPEKCPPPRVLADYPNQNNTDESQDPSVENQFGGGTHTFTSAHDPQENTGVCQDTTGSTLAITNKYSPMIIGYG